ncbi:hypothetical protein PTTG_04971 [Puccinia triticina 1-1 BBBD Race 1]|uniref:CCHC-type domain-containing protein n=1 Tax=Puccinia triticina (isolate 1-1 / race 1 (BBBD)) TaxID=630390 RepID=A0A0C4EVY5_PUCT1|nr:hypothetical protein PTTG_04971 [Puccinia triticina 1-1 BBBD Race 1]
MAPVNRSPSSIATRSTNAAAATSSSNAAGKRVARSPPPTSDDEIDTVRAPREEPPHQPAPRVNLPDNDAPLPPDFSYALDSKNKDQIIKHAHHLFPESKKLLPSGSNFRTWLMKMEELADFPLDYHNFYFEDFSPKPQPTPVRGNSIESHPDNVYTLAACPTKFKNSPSQTRHCFRCGSSAHLISNCPVPPETAQKSSPANHPTQNRLQTPQYQAYYPILAPPVPGYGFQQFYQPIVHTGNSPANTGRPADNYQPVYPQSHQPRPAAREALAEVPPDGPQMFVMQPTPQMFMPQEAPPMFGIHPAPQMMYTMPQGTPSTTNLQPSAQMFEMD